MREEIADLAGRGCTYLQMTKCHCSACVLKTA
jgi:hypothetical protein